MSGSSMQRVDDALQQLVARLVPPNPDNDEDDEAQRWEESLQLARRSIDPTSSPAKTDSDTVSHAADLIRAKLVRDTNRPDKATKFSSLYTRLLQQPVLDQKWAILYFLYRLAAPDTSALQTALEQIGGAGGGIIPGSARGHRSREDLAPETSGRESRRSARLSEAGRKQGAEPHSARTLASPISGSDIGSSSARRTAPVTESVTRQPTMASLADAHSRPASRRDHQTASTRPGSQRSKPDLRDATNALLAKQPGAPGEMALLRDLPFTLQGLDSTHLPFKDQRTLRLPAELPVPLVGLLNVLAEPALLYKQLAAYVESAEGGLVGQSLRAAIGEELRAYLGLVGTLESQIRSILEAADANARKAQVTLKKCVVWTREATLGLRLMSMIVEDARGKKGGALISLIHRLSTSHGDPFVHTFATRILHKVTEPFYTMLEHWIFRGELQDPFDEFFVVQNPEADLSSPTSIWTDKYQLDHDLLPSILSADIASRIFLIGKSINFIRSSCSDSAWVESYTATASRDLSFSDPVGLDSAISSSYKATTARVLELMSSRFQLFEHLAALKKYLLLGQGDFVALLLESLAGNLDSPANAQYRHHLTSALDHSIRNSNAQYEPPDITRRLDARMLELSHGEIGWDVFTLEYRMDSPLDVVVDAWSQKQYLKIFNFLWRIKRVEFTLGQVWGRCMTGSRGVLRFTHEAIPRVKGEKAPIASGSEDAALRDVWKRVRGGLGAMIHFVGQLQYYILFEVIESGWEKLKAEMAKPTATLDTLIAAHRTYLHSITRKGLLAAPTAPSAHTGISSSSTTTTPQSTADFTSQLHELLKLMLSYRDAVEALYSHSVAAYTTRGQPGPIRGTSRTQTRPLIAIPGEHDDSESGSESASARRRAGEGIDAGVGLDRIRARLAELEDRFRRRVEALLGDLAYQQDTDMRFLGVAMNFNDVYRVTRRRRVGVAAEKSTAGGAAAAASRAGGGGGGGGGGGVAVPA